MISFYWSNRDWLVCFLPRNCSCVIARDYEIDAIRFFFRSMHFSRSCFLLVCIPAKRRGEGRKGGKGRIFRKMNDWWSSENRSRENKEIRGFGTSRGVKSVYIYIVKGRKDRIAHHACWNQVMHERMREDRKRLLCNGFAFGDIYIYIFFFSFLFGTRIITCSSIIVGTIRGWWQG